MIYKKKKKGGIKIDDESVSVSGAPFRRVRKKWVVGPIDKMTTDISVVRGGWDPTLQQEIVDEYEYDGGNSSSRLFERSRIKALAGTLDRSCLLFIFIAFRREARSLARSLKDEFAIFCTTCRRN